MGRCLLVSQSRDGGLGLAGILYAFVGSGCAIVAAAIHCGPFLEGGGVVGSEGPSTIVPLSNTHMNDARVKSEIPSMFILLKSDTLHNSHKSRVSASPISSFSPTQGRVRTSFYGPNK